MTHNTRLWLLSTSVAIVVALSVSVALAWAGPTQTAPAGNTSAPINVSATSQVKSGGIWASSIGSDSGYCIGASCISTWPATTTNPWTLSGTSVYYNGGPVGIGTANPMSSQSNKLTIHNGTNENFNFNGPVATSTGVTLNVTNDAYNANIPLELRASALILGMTGNVGIGTVSPGYPLSIVGRSNNWAEVINWPPSSAPGYGILVGTSASGYSQFQNNAGYYSLLADSSWGLYTNGNVEAADYWANGTAGITGSASIQETTGNCGQGGGLWGSEEYAGGLVTSPLSITFMQSGGQCDGDIAERYGTEGQMPERGDIVMLGSDVTSRPFTVSNPAPGESTSTPYTITTAKVRLATYAARDLIYGAVPTAPFIIGSDVIASSSNPQLVALIGHVPVKMTLDGGDVHIGDPITVSTSTPGAGMKATTSGRILGFALDNFTATSTGEDGSGMIEVSIHLENWIAPDSYETVVHSKEVDTQQLCVVDANGKTCLTRAQIDMLLTSSK